MKTVLIGLTIFLTSVTLAAQSSPKVVKNPDPVYPPEAASLGYGRTVRVAIRVNKKGQVKVLNAWGPNAPCSDLEDERVKRVQKAVVDAAKLVEFEPPLQEGKPTEMDMVISYSFDSKGLPLRGAKGEIADAGLLPLQARDLARPEYPAGARANRVSGAVSVNVLVAVDGRVIAASARSGHPLLQKSAVEAACRSTIEPVKLSGVPIQVSGVVTFIFAP